METKHKQYTKLKKYLLQNLLPTDKTIPNIRFKEFSEEYNTTTIKNIFHERTKKGGPNHDFLNIHDNTCIIKSLSNPFSNDYRIEKTKYKIVFPNDLLYNSGSLNKGVTGVSECIGVISQVYTILIPHRNTNSWFYANLFKTHNMRHLFNIYAQGVIGGSWSLKYNTLSKLTVPVPSKEEQDKIGGMFYSIDKMILLLSDKIYLFKQYKHGLLQRMFC